MKSILSVIAFSIFISFLIVASLNIHTYIFTFIFSTLGVLTLFSLAYDDYKFSK